MLARENAVDLWMASPPLAAPSVRAPRWTALAGAVIALLLGTLLTLAAEGWLRPAVAAPAVAKIEWPERPLAKEWRWSPPGAKVDHMFRTRR